jgi:hypothetical protein
MLHIALGGLDQVRDEIITPLQLDIDLGEGILKTIAEDNESVIDTDDPQDDQYRYGDECD